MVGVDHRPGPIHEGRPFQSLLAEGGRSGLGLADPMGRDLDVGRVEQDGAVGGPLDPVEQVPQDPEAGGDDPAGSAVDALGQDLDREDPVDQASQRGGQPRRLVVGAARVEADDEIDATVPALAPTETARPGRRCGRGGRDSPIPRRPR